MIIDIHTHAFPDRIAAGTIEKLQAASHTKPFTDGTAAALSASMKRAGVDWSVVLPVATNPAQVPRINAAAAKMNAHAAETGILSFGSMHPDYPDWRGELDRLAFLGFRGVKLHPPYQGADIDDPRYLRILDRCGELGLLVLIHAGLDVGLPGVDRASPAMIRRAIRSAGPVTLILAHMGGWRQWEEAEDLLADMAGSGPKGGNPQGSNPQESNPQESNPQGSNPQGCNPQESNPQGSYPQEDSSGIYLDTSFSLGRMTPNGDGYYQGEADLSLLDGERFVRMVRAFGTDRVLFGTDCPWGGQAEELAKFRALPLTDTEREAVLGGNAKKLLRQ